MVNYGGNRHKKLLKEAIKILENQDYQAVEIKKYIPDALAIKNGQLFFVEVVATQLAKHQLEKRFVETDLPMENFIVFCPKNTLKNVDELPFKVLHSAHNAIWGSGPVYTYKLKEQKVGRPKQRLESGSISTRKLRKSCSKCKFLKENEFGKQCLAAHSKHYDYAILFGYTNRQCKDFISR